MHAPLIAHAGISQNNGSIHSNGGSSLLPLIVMSTTMSTGGPVMIATTTPARSPAQLKSSAHRIIPMEEPSLIDLPNVFDDQP